MNTTKKRLLAALAAALSLGLSGAALADGKHGHGHHRHWGHHHGHDVHRHVVRERVIIERPVYVAPAYVPYPGYYAPPPHRHPGVVVSVDIPPIVIPLR